ncbi:hypothetical protein EXIGLDRAFT_828716 [Exidia glandulosa HHB12029]|uniref:MYND-type domain-containing protein n=1 Tax=Exidia glandulosa HHB12029 TaxID=1314781 RepID=A0A165QBE9_EXIGL|nr:hypothetical protein EXIGLDRAFT_828716 [Exidia glandulosa HHB12029]
MASGGPGSSSLRLQEAASCASLLYGQAIEWELRIETAATGHASPNRGETADPGSRDWATRISNSTLDSCDGIASGCQQGLGRDKMLLDAVRGLSHLYRDNAIPKPHATTSKRANDFSAIAWVEGARTARRVLDQLDSQALPDSDPAASTIKAHALYILSIAAPEDSEVYLRRLADLPSGTKLLLPEGEALAFSALRRLSESVPITSTKVLSRPRHAVIQQSSTPPIPFPSASNSRSHSRSGSLFSVVVTPASYISAPTSPSLGSPLSSSPDAKLQPCPAGRKNLNPLLDRVLGRRTRRAQSLQGSPTIGLTAGSSVGSFTPPECDIPDGQQVQTTTPPLSPRVQVSGSRADRRATRSATLPSAGTATRSLRALFAQAHGQEVPPSPRRARPSMPWSWWSAPSEPCASESESESVHAEVRAPSPPASPRSLHSEGGGCFPQLDAALALQERSSRLLGSRKCARCGASGGSFPQCARGCGVAWCSRECRMEHRKAHAQTCRVAVNGGKVRRANATIG